MAKERAKEQKSKCPLLHRNARCCSRFHVPFSLSIERGRHLLQFWWKGKAQRSASRVDLEQERRGRGALREIATRKRRSLIVFLSFFFALSLPRAFSLALSTQTHRAVSMFFEPSSKIEAMDCLFSSLATVAGASASGWALAFVVVAAAAPPSLTCIITPGLDVVAGDAMFVAFCRARRIQERALEAWLSRSGEENARVEKEGKGVFLSLSVEILALRGISRKVFSSKCVGRSFLLFLFFSLSSLLFSPVVRSLFSTIREGTRRQRRRPTTLPL